MKYMKTRICLSVISAVALIATGCSKYLDAKSDKQLEEPSSLQDLQAIIDYYSRVNNFDAGAGVNAADEYYLSDADYNSLKEEAYRNLYSWQNDNVFVLGQNNWSYTYDNVYRANTVVEGLTNIPRTQDNGTDWDNCNGQALFLRGKSFFEAAVIWTLAYDSIEADKDLGLPLRLSTDFNTPSVRSTLQQTYDQIITDIKASIGLLPVVPLHVLRASKPAACAMLARVYLSMRIYDSCYKYTDMALKMKDTLLDYNSLDTTAAYPVKRLGPEIIMENMLNLSFSAFTRIDSSLYKMFDSNDLRKQILFNDNADGSHSFGGSYEGSGAAFGGIATDELYLMRAECLARSGNTAQALTDLNTLLTKRYRQGTFSSLVTGDPNKALQWVLDERRKELMMRGLRWLDIKRLNKEGADIILQRIINGQTYTLPPDDLRYAMAIPDDVIGISGMQQNPR